MKKILLAPLLAALSLPAAADLTNLNALTQDQFRKLSEDLGAAFSYKGVTPATSLGPWGFDIALAADGAKRSIGAASCWNPLRTIHVSMDESKRFIFKSASMQTLRSEPENCAVPWRIPARRPTISTPCWRRRLRSRVTRSGVPMSCGEGTRRARSGSLTSSMR